MLQTLNMTFQLPELSSEDRQRLFLRYYPKLGSYFHSVFMQAMARQSPALFERLHQPGHQLRPFKLSWPKIQHNQLRWSVSGLDASLCEFLQQWQQAPPEEIILEQLDLPLKVQQIDSSLPVTYAHFAKRHYGPEAESVRLIRLDFQSPATFKWIMNGHYYPFPDPRLILQSALDKWNAFAGQSRFDDPEFLAQLVQCCRIRHHQIKTITVSVDRGKIPCFVGQLTLHLVGSQVMRNLISLLLHYETFCGVGAKAQMGLGDVAVNVVEVFQNIPEAEKQTLEAV